jgi:hypothetical protein
MKSEAELDAILEEGSNQEPWRGAALEWLDMSGHPTRKSAPDHLPPMF